MHPGIKHWHDIRVRQATGRFRRTQQELCDLGVGRFVNDGGFDRDFAPQHRISGQIHHSLGTTPQRAQHPKAADLLRIAQCLCSRHGKAVNDHCKQSFFREPN